MFVLMYFEYLVSFGYLIDSMERYGELGSLLCYYKRLHSSRVKYTSRFLIPFLPRTE